MRRSLKLLLACGAAALVIATGGPSQAAGSVALSAESPSATWSGTATSPIAPDCLTATAGDAICTTRTLTTSADGIVDIVVAGSPEIEEGVGGDRWDVIVYDADAAEETVVAVGAGSVTFAAVAGEGYLVTIKPVLAVPGNTFTATATLTIPPVVVEEPAAA